MLDRRPLTELVASFVAAKPSEAISRKLLHLAVADGLLAAVGHRPGADLSDATSDRHRAFGVSSVPDNHEIDAETV